MTDLFYLPENLLHLQSSVEKTDDNSELQIYSYRSCNNESPDDLKAYRGLIFDGSVLVASSLGFTPEYNEETMSTIPHSNLSDYTFFPAKEGTLLRVFHYKKWYLSTHRKLDAFKSRWGSNESFGDIFLKCIGKTFEEFTENLCIYNVYFFLIRNTQETRIVSNAPDTNIVYHIGTLVSNETFDMTTSIGVPKQNELSFASVEDVRGYVETCDPFQTQGVIAFKKDGSGKHFKIIRSLYQNYVCIRNNEPDTGFRFLELLRDQSSPMYHTFLILYPQYLNKVLPTMNFTFKIAKHLHNMYFKKFVKKEKVVCQKDEWSILSNVHQWFWAERTSRKVTFEVMHKLALSDANIRAFYRIMKIVTSK